MSALAPDDFPAFFKAVWGYDPFPWQADLARRLATGCDPRRGDAAEPGVWPDVLDLPTGSGKTAALDIAVFHLALEADKGEARRAPIRIAYVVDRRLIVDDAFARAERLCEALQWALLDDASANALAPKEPELAEMLRRIRAAPAVRRTALRLRGLAGADQPPLLARSLRGGAPREDDWSRTPVQPTILCSTVDQVGSRLLFRGYGVSDRMKPIHAGLLGSDCLILLDEAHLSEPFRQTLKAVKRLRKRDSAPFSLALLTATPAIKAERPFGLSMEDKAHPILSQRIRALKPARLIEIAGKQGVDTESRRTEVTAAEALSVLVALRGRIANPAVGVVLNRVTRARAVFERLRSELAETVDVMLVIGPARTADHGRLAKLADLRTGRDDLRGAMTKPLIVVATQTIEVGVDVDFDGLITEAAPLDSLRQRFGRLNRAGRGIEPAAVVLAHKEDISAKADDPVYGDRIAKTWEALNRWKANAVDGRVDFGIEAMTTILTGEEVSELTAELLDAPILLPAYADLWSQTSPIPNADPDVALFLHGSNRSLASVQIVWRADLGEREDLRNGELSRLVELFTLMPPRSAEAVEAPLWAVRAWLCGPGRKQSDFADAAERETDEEDARTSGRPVFRWAGKDSKKTGVIRAAALRPGDLIIVPAEYGGCDEWGWKPESPDQVSDVADEAARPYSVRRFAVRVAPGLLVQDFRRLGILPPPSLLEKLAATLADHREDRSSALLDAVLELDLPQEVKERLETLKHHRLEPGFPYGLDGEERPRGVVFVASSGVKALAARGAATSERSAAEQDESLAALPATESEDLGAFAENPTSLTDHCCAVRSWAEAFVERAGLSTVLATDVSLAALLHDFGKADPRYQAYYAGGDPYGFDSEQVWAKSGQRRLPRGAWERAGLPDHWRHEALSVRIAQRLAVFGSAKDPMLVLWLIGSHHGYGRPLFPHADANDEETRPGLLKTCGGEGDLREGPGPQSLAFNFDGLDWAQMFEALKARYGIWGLAWLESFVRLADHRASEAGAPPEAVQPHKEAAE